MRAALPPVRSLVTIAVLAAAVACSRGEQASTPTGIAGPSPAAPQPAQGATVSGSVTAAGHPAGGVRVSVDGTSLAAVTDAAGAFALDGVAPGDRVVRFSSSAGQGTVSLAGVQADERIVLDVSLSPAAATVSSLQRSTLTSPTPTPLQLSLAVEPSRWSTSWATSGGTVDFVVSGQGFDRVDLSSIALRADVPETAAFRPIAVASENGDLRATFRRSDAIRIFRQPIHPVQISPIELDVRAGGKLFRLTATVEIVN